jgi:hypothetical protein
MSGLVVDLTARSGKVFEGMAYPEDFPSTVPGGYVTRAHMFDVPGVLRERAVHVLGTREGGVWWTVGEFRYAGEDFSQAVARRVMRDGRMVVEYGLEDYR